jgi:hypothetical protein
MERLYLSNGGFKSWAIPIVCEVRAQHRWWTSQEQVCCEG